MFGQFQEDVVIRRDFETQVENSLMRNEDDRHIFESAKEDWLANAAILSALGKPLGPKPIPTPVRKVSLEEKKIVITHGPETNGDPNFDYIPPANPPSGVFKLGPHDWGSVWGVDYTDTMKPGHIETLPDGRRFLKHGNLFGRGWYELLS